MCLSFVRRILLGVIDLWLASRELRGSSRLVRLSHVMRTTRPLALALVLVWGCHRAAPTTEIDAAPSLPVTASQTNLLLTWIDDKGEFHVESSTASVPEESRAIVRVVDPSRPAPSDGTVLVADLRAAGPDGSFPVRAMPRAEFEALAVERRQKHGEVLVAKQATPEQPTGERPLHALPTVIVYSASWCGVCRQAKAHLKGRGVPFIEKDIEADPRAASEMQRKLATVGRSGGAIPVLDIGGHILVGFDAATVDRLLKES